MQSSVARAAPIKAYRPDSGSAGAMIFWVCLAGYLAIAVLFSFAGHVRLVDSVSRIANAYYVVFGRDPHLASVGFVWSPLPSLVLIPALPIKPMAPWLFTTGFVGSVRSAVFMAGSVYQIYFIVHEIGVRKRLAWALVVLFAVDPMILYYSANGMSESMLLFFLILAVRYFARWMRSGDQNAQVYAGLALGAAYLTRYEAIAAGVGAMLVAGLITFARTPSRMPARTSTAITDALIVGGPFILAFTIWAGASWLIMGHPFEEFASVYSNQSYIHNLARQGADVVLETTGPGGIERGLGHALIRMLALEPFLPLAVAMVTYASVRARNAQVLAYLGILCPVIAFVVLTYLSGALFGLLRFYIYVVPLGVIIFALALSPGIGSRRMSMGPTTSVSGLRSRIRTALTIALAAAALPTSALAMTSPSVSRYEANELRATLEGDHATGWESKITHRLETEEAIASYLDGLHLKRGAVLVDAASGFAIILASQNPKQFVITPDRDFNAALADPAGSGVQYVLVPDPEEDPVDAVNRAYVSAYSNGGGLGILIHDFLNVADFASWRLYRVTN